ncbi:MAG: hypothetical protein H7338_03750, partial [Candidatus Sericytochromatia bacterium]|nr:hypothetical protein [Candidatus Sericytochromatia bacterium]
MGRRVTILGSLAMMAVSSCGAPPPLPSPPVHIPVTQQSAAPLAAPSHSGTSQAIAIDTLAKGDQSLMHQPGYQIIRSAGELQSLARQAGLKDFDTEVDWGEQMVVAVFAGDRPGTIDIASMQAKGDILTAKVTFQPGTGAPSGSGAGSRAYHLVVVPKSTAELNVRGLPEPQAAVPTPTASAAASPAPVPVAGSSGAPVTAPPGTSQDVVQLIAQGPTSGVKQPVNVVIQNAEEWNAVWGVHAKGIPQAQSQPAIDLTKRSIIGIFLGEQTQGVSGIAIDSIEPGNGKVIIKGHVVGGGQAAAQPFLIMSVPKTSATVEVQIQGGPQAQTLGNPGGNAQAGAGQPGAQPAQPAAPTGFGQPGSMAGKPGFGQPVGGSSLGGMPGGPNLGSQPAPPFPGRGGILGGGGGGLPGP